MNRKRIVTLLLLIFMIVVISFITYFIMSKVNNINQQVEDMGITNEALNNNSKIVNGITFESVNIDYEDLKVVCTINIKNDSKKFIKGNKYNIIFLDRKGNKIHNKIINIDDMRINKKMELKEVLNSNIKNKYYDFKVEKMK